MARIFHDWSAVQAYHDDGHGVVECAKHFGFTKSGWNKAMRRGALTPSPAANSDGRRRYNWAEIQAYYDTGASFRKCKARFGFHAAAWGKAVRRGEMKPRSTSKTIAEVLDSRSSRWRKKAKLIREGYLDDCCSICGISEWCGKRLVIQIDHQNGVKDDWRMENLRMLCPNCHSQTDTFSGRNARRAGKARFEPTDVV
jgi:hypothetical protein